MGPSYKIVQPRQYKVSDDDFARTNQYDPEITEMYDDEEECMMNERYVELANAGRNLSEAELSELKTLSEKIEQVNNLRKNYGASQGGIEPNVFEGRCEDYPCCGHYAGSCPDRDGQGNEIYRCVGCGNRLPQNSKSSLCKDCLKHRMEREDEKPMYGGDYPDVFENTVNMKMGPSHKTVQQRLYKTSDDDFARTNQYDPQISEVDCEQPTNQGHKGQSGFRLWICSKCGHELNALSTERRPDPIRWDDGHVCNFIPAKDGEGEGVGAEPVGIGEVGGGAVQHSSYRTVDHGNLPQKPKQRWADDLDEVSKKLSKVAKAIAKGQKPAKTKKNPLLKFQKAKKTTSGVHKRKT
jgi:rubrerythrin